MINLEDDQTSLNLLVLLVTDTHDNLNRVNSEENLRAGHLNL